MAPAEVERARDPAGLELQRAPGIPRRDRSVLTIEPSVQRFRWVPRTAGSRTIVAPAARSRIPSSMSSTAGAGEALSVEAAGGDEVWRRTAPRPAQKVSAGPARMAWTWWWSRLRNRDTVPGSAGARRRRRTPPEPRVGGERRRSRASASGSTATSRRRTRSARGRPGRRRGCGRAAGPLPGRIGDDDQLVGRLGRAPQRGDDSGPGWAAIGRRDDHGQGSAGV